MILEGQMNLAWMSQLAFELSLTLRPNELRPKIYVSDLSFAGLNFIKMTFGGSNFVQMNQRTSTSRKTSYIPHLLIVT